MATTPTARTIIDAESGGASTGGDTITVIAPVPLNADGRPRRFGSAKAVADYHGYCEGVEYVAEHVASTGKAVLFCGVPIAVPGAVGAHNTSGNTGTSVSTVTAAPGGCLTEHDGVVTVLSGGTVGTDQIVIGLSLDGGRSSKRVRLGTSTSYTVPYVGVSIAFTVGTLKVGETVHTWHGTGPLPDASGVALARTELAKTQQQSKGWIVIGDAQDDVLAFAVLSQANNYASENSRFVSARVSVRDRLPHAQLSVTSARSSATAITFAEVGSSGDTITRSSGSFITDGFMIGDLIDVSGTPGGTNDFDALSPLTGVTATVLTLGTDDVVDQGPVAGVIIAHPSLQFANTGETITRNRGSWLADGFRVGQTITLTGTSSDGQHVIEGLTDTVMTLEANAISLDQTLRVSDVTITAGETKVDWLANLERDFASVDSSPRLNLGLGRARKVSEFTGYMYRRPSQWAVSAREYQHDVHIATWKRDEGALAGWTILDAFGNLAEYDDRVDGGFASAARFTSLTSTSNGPGGALVSLDLTRAEDATVLSYHHNMAVVNLAQGVVQRATEYLIGSSVQLNPDGTATADALKAISARVNRELQREVLVDRGEGVRASKCLWTPSADDILSGAEAVLTGTLYLVLNGTLHTIITTFKVR